jgi:hypothetical protein
VVIIRKKDTEERETVSARERANMQRERETESKEEERGRERGREERGESKGAEHFLSLSLSISFFPLRQRERHTHLNSAYSTHTQNEFFVVVVSSSLTFVNDSDIDEVACD